ncbi:MAG: diguanylate cyclase [Gammaproteobacteria bacterium]|nr:diguanylate cyclase [Gammaproteobacteria bacterium]
MICSHEFVLAGNTRSLRVTVSVGGAVFPTDATSADQLIETADQMLYQAKRTGKNRVVTYQADTKSDLCTASGYYPPAHVPVFPCSGNGSG